MKKNNNTKKIIRYILNVLCIIVSVFFLTDFLDNFKNWIKSGDEYKVVENNEKDETLYYSLVINEEEIEVISPEDYIYNNVMEGGQIKNAYICEGVKDILKSLILLITLISCCRLVNSLLFGESLQKEFSNFFKNISIMSIIYLIVPNMVWFILRQILTKDVFFHSISYNLIFILLLGCINVIAYYVHNRGIKVKYENDLIA